MKKINKFEKYYKGVTTGTTIFLVEIIILMLVVKLGILNPIPVAPLMCIAMMSIGFLPVLVQILANKCNPKEYNWTPLSFITASVLNIVFSLVVICMNYMDLKLMSVALIPLSVLLIFFSSVMVTLVNKGYDAVFKRTSMQLYTLWCVLWIFIGISIL